MWSRAAASQAAGLLAALEDMHGRAGRDFPAYLHTLTDTHHRKTAFLAELARTRH